MVSPVGINAKSCTGIYIAYSTHLNLEEMRYYCPCAQMVATTEIPGYSLMFYGEDFMAVPSIEPDGSGRAPGVVWRVPQQGMCALDMAWHCPGLYHRETFEVKAHCMSISAFSYVINRLPSGKTLPYGRPSLKTYAVIAKGYRCHGFDSRILEDAITRSEPKAQG